MSTAITMNDVSSSGVSCAADAGAVDVEVCGTGAGVVDADGGWWRSGLQLLMCSSCS